VLASSVPIMFGSLISTIINNFVGCDIAVHLPSSRQFARFESYARIKTNFLFCLKIVI
jgi:hypothetical protein